MFCLKTKKEFALNKLFNLLIILGLLLAWVAIELFIERAILLGLGVGVVALAVIILPAIFTPYCYMFDAEGVSLCYVFFPEERYLWKNIHAVDVMETITTGRVYSSIYLFFGYVFSISGANEGKTRFYMKGHIRKSFRTKYLIEKYWDGTIEGLFINDIKNWIRKRKHKKEWEIKAHLSDDAVRLEREARAKAREWLEPFIAEARQYDLEIKAEYFYVTKDFEELKSRPKEGYTYTIIAQIAHFNETDENRMVLVDSDLLYVRLGKTAYKVVENKTAREDLEFYLSDTLKEIKENGIEVYCKND